VSYTESSAIEYLGPVFQCEVPELTLEPTLYLGFLVQVDRQTSFTLGARRRRVTRPHCLRGKGPGTCFIGDLLGLRTDIDEVEKKSTPQELEPRLPTLPALA